MALKVIGAGMGRTGTASLSEGWEPLCEFLDVPVPDIEFPRINSRDETKEMLATLIAACGEELSDEAMAATAHELHGD